MTTCSHILCQHEAAGVVRFTKPTSVTFATRASHTDKPYGEPHAREIVRQYSHARFLVTPTPDGPAGLER